MKKRCVGEHPFVASSCLVLCLQQLDRLSLIYGRVILHKNDTHRRQVLRLLQWLMELTAFLHIWLRLEPPKEEGCL